MKIWGNAARHLTFTFVAGVSFGMFLKHLVWLRYFSSYFLKFSILCFSYLLCFYNSCRFAGVLLNNLAHEISTLFFKDLTHAGVDWRCSVLALFFYFVLELYIISSPWLSTSCITTLLMYNHNGVLFASSLQSAYI